MGHEALHNNSEVMAMSEQSFVDDGDLRKYRTELPNMADDELDPFQYRLYGHYKRVCGAAGGECYESVRTTAEKTKMSNEKVISTRQWLADNGWITIDPRAKGTFLITITDRWGENFVRYSEQSKSKTVRNSERSESKTVRNSEQSTRKTLEIPNNTVRNSEQPSLEISNQRSNHIKKEQSDDHMPGTLLRSMVESAGFMYLDRNFIEVAGKLEADYSHEQLIRALQSTTEAHKKKINGGERGITAPLAYMKSVLIGDGNNGSHTNGQKLSTNGKIFKPVGTVLSTAENLK
jgi:hypothetical protein